MRGLRGDIRGWSRGSARRHVTWLQSVDGESIGHLYGYGVTLTVRVTPEGASAWSALRLEWLRYVEREHGVVLAHWVTELTKRRVPHLHLGVWSERELSAVDRARMCAQWCIIAARYGAGIAGQHIKPMHGNADVWSRYLAKHASRSVAHYQRQGMPPGWTKSGRLWGHRGPWPVISERYAISGEALADVRRLLRSWASSQARSELRAAERQIMDGNERGLARAVAARRSLVYSRRMLRGGLDTAPYRAVLQWVPDAVMRRWLATRTDVRVSLPGDAVDLMSEEAYWNWRARQLARSYAQSLLYSPAA